MRKPFFTLLLLVTWASCLSLTGSAQTRRPRAAAPAPAAPAATEVPPLPVTLTLKDGQSLKGMFISANPRTVTISIGSSRQEFNTGEIASLIFAESAAAQKADSAAADALGELRKLQSAVTVGVNIGEYGRRLVDAKVAIDQFMPRVPEGGLKSELEFAMAEYELASEYWEIFNRMMLADEYNTGWADTSTEWGASLMKRYNLTPHVLPSSKRSIVMREEVLSAAWQAATEHIEKAAKLLNP